MAQSPGVSVIAQPGRRILELRACSDEDLLQVLWVAPGQGASGEATLEVLAQLLRTVLADVLGDGVTGGIGVTVFPREADSLLSIALSARDDGRASELLAQLDAALSEFRNELPCGDSLRRAQRRVKQAAQREHPVLVGRALHLARHREAGIAASDEVPIDEVLSCRELRALARGIFTDRRVVLSVTDMNR